MTDTRAAARMIEEAAASHGATPHGIRSRAAREEDIPVLAGLLVRLKRLNEEFDPLMKVRADAEVQAEKVLHAALKDPRSVVLIGEGTSDNKIVGVVRAALRDRVFYVPEMEGVIQDIYLLPAFRRKSVGDFLLTEAARVLKEKGAGIVIAEFPAQNQIATRFYAKRGFRPIISTHAKTV